jgi:hypothetical protein
MKSVLLSLLLCGSVAISGRAADQHADNYNLWLNYVGDHPLFGTPWGVHLEMQNRREDWGDEWQQLLIRPGINYTISPTVTVSAGYGYVKIYPWILNLTSIASGSSSFGKRTSWGWNGSTASAWSSAGSKTKTKQVTQPTGVVKTASATCCGPAFL